MRIKILLILVLMAAVLVSSTVGTLSSYTRTSSFGVSVGLDLDKIRQQSQKGQTKELPLSSTTQPEKVED